VVNAFTYPVFFVQLPVADLAANLRRAFSGIVSGNIREEGIRAIEQYGPFEIRGDRTILAQLDGLLRAFVEQHHSWEQACAALEDVYRGNRRSGSE
jgi:hypothetical protein